ncbi:23S ribosomal RNA methyltransferase Erm [Actinoplanes sp. NPDC049265]|uniref:23S ribosomal RNA methyltransferase Erm n=1 Tax=Actinoplanes sp. NPDC049265 TaxID=3363902 RepID=UPI00371FB6DB
MAPSSARRARRSYGQNFLSSRRALRQVCDAADLKPDDLVYEVGAGRGHLTRMLVPRCGRVIAYEVDPALLTPVPGASVVAGDFLRAEPPRSPFVVVGNVPFALTAAVVSWCLTAEPLRHATLVTQREYARKRTGDYGRWSRLTLLTWPTHDWHLGPAIPRTAFRPVPAVDGAILRLVHREIPLVPEPLMPAWRQFVELGFSGVGGSLPATLRRRYGRPATGACRAVRVGADVTVGAVWPEQWLTLFRVLERDAG